MFCIPLEWKFICRHAFECVVAWERNNVVLVGRRSSGICSSVIVEGRIAEKEAQK